MGDGGEGGEGGDRDDLGRLGQRAESGGGGDAAGEREVSREAADLREIRVRAG